uniref:F-box domain-containing protein n=1 Tax=Mycena chlorophos TaxID=658473 RepID=A0ABQ0LN90_MYCCL|nr:predicted protein [Mycena chlorophos]
MAALPAELIDLVVENIEADDDMQNLKSCCLAASLFQHPCQKRIHRSMTLLFDSVLLDGDDVCASPHYRWRNILQHLENHPHLAEYVVELQLLLPSTQSPEEYADDVLPVSSVLNKLHKVRELEIAGLTIGGPPCVWSRLPLQFTDDLFAWLHTCDGRLVHICCCFVDELSPSAIQHMLVASSSLEFKYCRVYGEISSFTVLPQPTSGRSLRRLRFHESDLVILFFLRAECQENIIKGLKKLSLGFTGLPGPPSQLCCAVGDSIEDLTLYLRRSRSEHTERDLGLPQQFPHLRRLSLGLAESNHNKDILLKIIQVCFSAKIAPALSRIVVNMSVWERNVEFTLASRTFENDLDDYCATHPTVKKLSLVLSFSTAGNFKDSRWRAENSNRLHAAFPKMAEKGRLDVELK